MPSSSMFLGMAQRMPRAGVYSVGGQSPQIAADVFLAPGCIVVGDVEIGAGASVWFNAVIRADNAPIRIGPRTNIQDGAVLHADPGLPCLIAADVTVGHRAIVHGASVGEGSTIGMGATVLNGASIGKSVIVAAGAVVLEGSDIPDGVLVAGVPAREKRHLDAAAQASAAEGASSYVRNSATYQSSLHPVDVTGEARARGN